MTIDTASCFIGSSKEGLGYAKALAGHLRDSHDVQCEIWTQSFALGQTTVESLDDALARHSFAVLIATADDLTKSRGRQQMSPRDNVILEFGLFVGRLGRDRAFLLVENTNLKLPSDLLGVTLGRFEGRKTAEARKKCVESLAEEVATQVKKLGPLETPSDPAVTNDLLMSASRLVRDLRTTKKAKMPSAQHSAWVKDVLNDALEPFLTRADDAYSAWLRPNEEDVLVIVEAINLGKDDWHEHRWKKGEGLASRVWETSKAVAVDKHRPHKWFIPRAGCENQAYLCVPLGGASAIEGVIAVGSDEGFDVRQGDLALLAVYASLLAFAMPKLPTANTASK